MVPNSVLSRIRADAPKMNPDIANGLITRLLPSAEVLLDGIWRAVAEKFPPGLKYLGYSRCTPEEEFTKLSFRNEKKDSRLIVEIAKNTMYPVRYRFSYEGVEIPNLCYIFLPYVDMGGSMMISGSTYFATPILSDVVLSFEGDGIFVKVMRDKFNIRVTNHDIKVNGKADTVPVVRSALYHPKDKGRKSKTKKKESTESGLAHYLFCKYGVIETFERFANCTPIVINKDIDNTTYDCESYVTVESMGYISQIVDDIKTATPIKLVFKKDEFTPMARSLAAGFFYVVDKHPNKIHADIVAARLIPNIPEAESEHQTAIWIWNVILGFNISGKSQDYSSGKLNEVAIEHIKSLDDYIDEVTKRRLRKIDIDVNDIYDFFAAIIERFNDYMAVATKIGSSIYYKELSGLLDILSPITQSIFKFHYQLRKLEKRDIGKMLTLKDIQLAFKSQIKPRCIFELNKGGLGVTNISYSGDCMPLKVTASVTPQKNVNGKSSNKDRKEDDPMRRLHVSFAEVGNIFMLSRATPIGNEKINPYIQITPDGSIIRNQGKMRALDYAQQMIDRTTRQQANVLNADQ